EECLKSILCQEVGFEYEVLIGDDDSQDGSWEIAKRFASENPDRVRLYRRSRENVIYVGGKPTGRFNFAQTIQSARGKYIALCEGDDYWSDPSKLSRQVQLLERQPTCAFSFHKVSRLVDGVLKNPLFPALAEVLDIEDFITRGKIMIHTSTIVFRQSLLELDQGFFESVVGDKFIILNLGAKGKIGYVPRYMSVYRIHDGGIWSSRQTDVSYMNSYTKGYIWLLEKFDEWTNRKYHRSVCWQIERIAYDRVRRFIGTTSVEMEFRKYLGWKHRL